MWLFLFLVFSTQPSSNSAAFAALPFRETPFPPLRGSRPLSEPEAETRNHYRFTYDAEGRPVEIRFQLGDQVRETNHSAPYFFPTPIMRIAYRGNLAVRTFYNRLGQRVALRGGTVQAVFELDAQGRHRRLFFLDKQRRKVENAFGVADYTWTIERAGTVIEERFDLAGKPVWLRPGFEFGRLRLHYRDDGHIALMQYLDEAGKLVENSTGAAQDRLELDRDGGLLAWNVLDAAGNLVSGNGPNVARGEQTLDEWGYEIGVRFLDEQGKAVANAYGFWGSRKAYDSFGNLVRADFLDGEGSPGTHLRAGYHRRNMHWDPTGLRLLAMSYHDLKGQAVPHAERGFARMVHEYDGSGNRTLTKYLDPSGQLIDRKDLGIAVISRRFDGHHRLVETRFLDAAGLAVNHPGLGYAKETLTYDAQGFVAQRKRFTAKGEALSAAGEREPL